MSFSMLSGGANSLPPNPIAGFEGPLRGGEREENGRNGRERKGRKGWEKTKLNFCLWPWALATSGNVALLWRSETITEAVSCISFNMEFRQCVVSDAGKLSQHVTFQRMQPASDDQWVQRWSKVNLCHLGQGRRLQTLTVGTNSCNSNAHTVFTQNCTQTRAACESTCVVLRTQHLWTVQTAKHFWELTNHTTSRLYLLTCTLHNNTLTYLFQVHNNIQSLWT